MSALELFNYGTHSVRVIDRDGEPWFVAADVAQVLELGNIRSSLALLDADEKGVHTVDTLRGPQSLGVINESGLYSLILRSRKSEAKQFKRWITHDVLPTIRKTGRYGSDIDMLAALPSAKLLRMAADAAEAAEAAKQRAAELEAPAAAWNDLAAAEGDMLVSDAAKVLNRAGIVIGPQRLFAWLADNGWIFRRGGYWVAKQTAADAGLIAERITDYRHPSGERRLAAPQIRITAKGLERLHALMTANQIEAAADGGA